MLVVISLGRKLLLDKAGIWYSQRLQMSQLGILQVVFCLDNWNHKAVDYKTVWIQSYYKYR